MNTQKNSVSIHNKMHRVNRKGKNETIDIGCRGNTRRKRTRLQENERGNKISHEKKKDKKENDTREG